LDELIEALIQDDEQPAETPVESVGHPPLVVFLGGIIIGSIAAVFLVLHANKSAALAKKGSKNSAQKRGPSSFTNLD
jgi:hypothetical protein